MGGHHDWACFASQQAAEMALKALHASLGQDVWGHGILKLINELPAQVAVPTELREIATALDLHYIPARYPNGHVVGSPTRIYSDLQSREAIGHARQIVEFCRSQMARS